MHRILIVEDEMLVARDIKEILEKAHYSVIGICSTGEDAVKVAEKENPDLVLIDVRLAGVMDGIEAASQLRETTQASVVFLTAHSDDQTIERAKKVQPYGFVLKPFDEQELRTAVDIALYKHEAELRVRESRRWATTTLSCISDAVLATDTNWTIQFLNPAASALLKVTQEAAIGSPLSSYATILSPTQQELSFPSITPASAAQKGFLRLREGTLLNLEFQCAPLQDERQVRTGTVWVLRDISEQVKIERERAQLEEQLFHAQKMEAIGQLAGGVAHDFNNLLTAILGNLSLLRQMCPPHLVERVYATEKACLRATDLVGQLLTFSRTSDAGSTEVRVDLITHEALEMAKVTFPPQITITTDIAPDLPFIQAEPNQIHQLLMNLFLNAKDALEEKIHLDPSSPATLLVKAHAKKSNGGAKVILEITDSGIGIPSELQNRIFDPFFTTKPLGKGTGLGLSVVYGIVKKYGGEIKVTSRDLQGTTFTVSFPAITAKRELSQKLEVVKSSPEKATLLIVEDEPLMRDLLKGFLKNEGYRVLFAEDGREALRVFQEWKDEISLVFSELLPDPPLVFTVLSEIHSLNSRVQFILSGERRPQKEDVTPQPLDFEFLKKPFKVHELARKIEEILENRELVMTFPPREKIGKKNDVHDK